MILVLAWGDTERRTAIHCVLMMPDLPACAEFVCLLPCEPVPAPFDFGRCRRANQSGAGRLTFLPVWPSTWAFYPVVVDNKKEGAPIANRTARRKYRLRESRP